jgi:hypothetical protein
MNQSFEADRYLIGKGDTGVWGDKYKPALIS